jgi:BirA family transcriptional regulator, biotin operon repressor / biotin---[acetyl-CoA-carboxylase] ligase
VNDGALVLPDTYRLIKLIDIDGTNAEAKRVALSGVDLTHESIVVWAETQTAGRGRRGREWISPKGNLYCSLLFNPKCCASDAGQLGLVASLALQRFISRFTNHVECKWPNDVLIQGQKVSGLLMETEANSKGDLTWLVLGVGVNISHHPEDMPFPATSLFAVGQEGITVAQMLEGFICEMDQLLSEWRKTGFSATRTEWLSVAAGLNQDITVRLPNDTLSGVFAGLDTNGALILDGPDGFQTINSGDVFFGAE